MPDECLTGSVWDDRGPPDRFSNAAGCQEVCAASGLYTQQLKRPGWPERRSVGLVCGQRGDVLIFPGCSRHTRVASSDDDRPASPDGELPRNETRESIVYLFAPPLHSSENVENPQFCNSALFFDDVAKRQWCDSQVSGRLPPPTSPLSHVLSWIVL